MWKAVGEHLEQVVGMTTLWNGHLPPSLRSRACQRVNLLDAHKPRSVVVKGLQYRLNTCDIDVHQCPAVVAFGPRLLRESKVEHSTRFNVLVWRERRGDRHRRYCDFNFIRAVITELIQKVVMQGEYKMTGFDAPFPALARDSVNTSNKP
jgi:hypothetical protein